MNLNAVVDKKRHQMRINPRRSRKTDSEVVKDILIFRKTVSNEDYARYNEFLDWEEENCF